MINVDKLGILLSKTDLSFEIEGVLNPGVIFADKQIHLFYRAVGIDNYSTIGYCILNTPTSVNIRNEKPLIVPEFEYEKHGVEDPRIVFIEGLYYLTYTAYDGVNALGALATSKDMINWNKLGIIVPQVTYEEFKHLVDTKGAINEKYMRFNEYQKSHDKQDKKTFIWDKNLVFFPRKINGKFCFLHRIKPDIQIIVSFNSISELTVDFWHHYLLKFDEYVVLTPKYKHEVSYIGAGCPPIETSVGWLLIYHGVHDTIKGYVYSACAALLDIENPQKEIARLPYPLFFPEKTWELKGEVNNVCFPTGAIVDNDKLYIYYGAADERIAIASINMQDLLSELILYKC
jgi:predicted GH43/DUF377 family glycosyl hydrolase